MAVSQTTQEKMLEEAYSATPNYDIDPNDKRFTAVNEQKDAALKELDATYAGMIGQTNQYYDDQIAALDKWEDKQTEIQNAQTDFTIQQIEQQKDKAHKDYLKEQSASYVDWQKQSNQYGANAEQMASSGLTNTGFAESSQVSMYNTYQNRVATARESYNNAVLNYNNSIKEAQLANSAALAEIAFTTLQKQLELSLAGFQYKNQLILEQANKKLEVDNMYWNRYQDVLQQINTENAMKEDIRQYNETMKWQTEQADLDRAHDEKMAEVEYNYQVKLDEAERTFKQKQAELDRAHDLAVIAAETTAAKEKADKEWEIKQKQLKQELADAKALAKYEYDLEHPTYGYAGGNNAKVAAMPKTKYGALHNTNPAIKYNPVKTYTPSDSVKKKINSLSLMRNQSGSKKAIANSICVYLTQGQITDKDAEYMLKYFGYDPDDYLD
jgi:hypothetical protein